MSDILCFMSDIKRFVSDKIHAMSDIRPTLSDIFKYMSDIQIESKEKLVCLPGEPEGFLYACFVLLIFYEKISNKRMDNQQKLRKH